jgi:hypothetical protein
MARLGPEHIGKLPPGAAEDLARELSEARELAKEGIVKGVKILAGPGCAVAEAQEGTVYPVDQVPALPLPGCQRSPCCGCDYLMVT